jgi:hypothetical protein
VNYFDAIITKAEMIEFVPEITGKSSLVVN